MEDTLAALQATIRADYRMRQADAKDMDLRESRDTARKVIRRVAAADAAWYKRHAAH